MLREAKEPLRVDGGVEPPASVVEGGRSAKTARCRRRRGIIAAAPRRKARASYTAPAPGTSGIRPRRARRDGALGPRRMPPPSSKTSLRTWAWLIRLFGGRCAWATRCRRRSTYRLGFDATIFSAFAHASASSRSEDVERAANAALDYQRMFV